MRNIKIIIIIILITLALFVLYLFLVNRNKQNIYFPTTPTAEEREAAKKLPKEECGCWDGINNVCLPQADCI